MNTIAIERIFHPSDFSSSDEAAFAHSLRIALAAKGELSLLHVNPPREDVHWSEFPSVRAVLTRWGLIPHDAGPEALAEIGLEVKKIQRSGADSASAIVDYLSAHKADLIVLSTHQRHGWDRLAHKSIAESTAARAHILTLFVPRGCPGFVLPETGKLRLRNILLPVDRSTSGQRAADAAQSLLRVLGVSEAHFTVFHGGSEAGQPPINFRQRPGWTVERSVWDGPVVEHILKTSEAQDIDLIVMATRWHHTVLDAVRGSTTERVLRGARCPLFVVPDVSV